MAWQNSCGLERSGCLNHAQESALRCREPRFAEGRQDYVSAAATSPLRPKLLMGRHAGIANLRGAVAGYSRYARGLRTQELRRGRCFIRAASVFRKDAWKAR